MSLKKSSEIESVQGNEGTKIKQYFHPRNTLNGINYSIAQFTLEPGKKSKLHKIKSSEIYYILEGTASLKIDEETASDGKRTTLLLFLQTQNSS